MPVKQFVRPERRTAAGLKWLFFTIDQYVAAR